MYLQRDFADEMQQCCGGIAGGFIEDEIRTYVSTLSCASLCSIWVYNMIEGVARVAGPTIAIGRHSWL